MKNNQKDAIFSNTNKMQVSNNNNPFDLLTEEIMYTILDYIEKDPSSKKSFSSTCKTFHHLESTHRKSLKPLRADLLQTTLNRYPHISSLDLTLCPRIDDTTLNMLCSSCNGNLRSINLSRSKCFTNVGLSSLVSKCWNLVELDLSNGVELDDLAAAAIAEAKNLERLLLGRCKLISDMGVGCIAVGCKKLRLLCLRWCLKVGDLGVELIALKCKEIRCLDLSYLPITAKCLASILQLQHLEDLILEGCHGIDDEGLSTIQHSCNSLKALNISHCQNVSSIGLTSLTRGAQNLEELIIAHGSFTNMDLVNCLQSFTALRSIKLDGCNVTCSGIKAIGNLQSSLKELSLSKCTGVTDESLLLVEAHKDLIKFDITCCREITYDSIDSMTSSCTSLSCLRMESCSSVQKEAFVLIGQRCHLLEELDVTDNEIDDEGLKAISRCARLSRLKLGFCLNITNDGLLHIGSSCSKLKELDLYRTSGISDAGIEAIAAGCPALEMINIAYNDKITDFALKSLSRCFSLCVLEIRGCRSVSSEGLQAIATGCRQLTVLDVKKCFHINDNGILHLAQFSHNLRQINLSYCSVTDVGLLALARINRLQNITILHLRGLSANGLAAALLACGGLAKMKLHASFKSLLPKSLLDYMESQGRVFHWRDKAFQMDIDPKGWKLMYGRN